MGIRINTEGQLRLLVFDGGLRVWLAVELVV